MIGRVLISFALASGGIGLMAGLRVMADLAYDGALTYPMIATPG
jgi:hypothetical protein